MSYFVNIDFIPVMFPSENIRFNKVLKKFVCFIIAAATVKQLKANVKLF